MVDVLWCFFLRISSADDRHAEGNRRNKLIKRVRHVVTVSLLHRNQNAFYLTAPSSLLFDMESFDPRFRKAPCQENADKTKMNLLLRLYITAAKRNSKLNQQ